MKKELDAIYKAFESYIKEQSYFDIVYSEKYGYVRVSTEDDEAFRLLDSPEKMLDCLCYDLISEVVFSPENPQKEHDGFILTEYEETESRRRLAEILGKLDSEAKTSYLDKIEEYIENYQQSTPLEDDDEDDEDDEEEEEDDE